MKVHDEKISIIIPVYNAQAYISETIESVLRQTYRNWELILVDNMSGDHSLEICRTYEEKYDNIFVYQEEEKGVRNYPKRWGHIWDVPRTGRGHKWDCSV